VLGLIAQLYDVEDEVRGRSDQGRLAARQERSPPVLKRLEEYLREQKGLALPKSQFGRAINYALNQWEALLLYASDGRLEIDKNSSERTLRPWAISRKNWMLFESGRGGETAAILMSILARAKRHGIKPFEYVRQLLIALSSADVELRSLLPDVWIAAHPEHFLQYRHDEAEAAARARKRRRAERRAKSKSDCPTARVPSP
jgi:transposase